MKRVVRDREPISSITAEPLVELTPKPSINYKKHVGEVYRLKRRAYFRHIKTEPLELISSAYVIMAEEGAEYDPDTFFKFIMKVLSRENYDIISKNSRLWWGYLKTGRDFKERSRKNATTWYAKHLLSKKYSTEYINNHPELVLEKRAQILSLRKNNNQPIDNGLPATNGLFDLSKINKEYKGYAITLNGDLFSCKKRNRSDVMFT